MSTALPTRRGRGRRILLWVVLIYAVTTVVLDVVIDGYWRGLRSPQLVDVLLQMEDCRPDGPDVICFGTSRLGSGFSGDDVLHEMVQLTGNSDLEVFNASNGSQDLITADFLMERMLARAPGQPWRSSSWPPRWFRATTSGWATTRCPLPRPTTWPTTRTPCAGHGLTGRGSSRTGSIRCFAAAGSCGWSSRTPWTTGPPSRLPGPAGPRGRGRSTRPPPRSNRI